MTTLETFVRKAIWSRDLGDEELERACKGVIEKSFAKGAYVCHRGDRLDYWTGVIDGLVKVRTISRGGKPMTFAGVAGGAWFGEGSVLKDEARQYDIAAFRDTRLAMMNRATFFWLYENSMASPASWCANSTSALGSSSRPSSLTASPVRAPVSLAICPGYSIQCFTRRSATEIAISQEELGCLPAFRAPLSNRALQELTDEGLIETVHGSIRVLDFPRLRTYELTSIVKTADSSARFPKTCRTEVCRLANTAS